MAKNLMIVESPAKAKTIEKFLGKDFKVESCYGHIRDLPSDKMAVDVKDSYSPTYVIPKDKQKVIRMLKKLAKEAEHIWLATDEDREGEAIAWHLAEALGIPENKARRVVFHEITKQAIADAIQSPRGIDLDMVKAQQARRILDRLVGYQLSPLLWRKINLRSTLSAGRVQSVAVRLIVEREREINKFEPEAAFKVKGLFKTDKGTFEAVLTERLPEVEQARAFLEACIKSDYTVSSVKEKPGKRSPAPPFTTSTLQQEASRKLGFSVSKTMTLAQRLYEAGHITYMRTDSVNLSKSAMQDARQVIQGSYGEKYIQPRTYKTKTAGAQEAHEAIRPTAFNTQKAGSERDEQRLYQLIWKRAIASQMSDARMDRTTVLIDVSEAKPQFRAKGEVLVFDGFIKVYQESRDEEPAADEQRNDLLPPLKEGQSLTAAAIEAIERFTRPPARYNEAMLVRKLEELGIGRPSTYAPTISTIQKRGYAEKRYTDGTPRKYQVLTLEDARIKKSIGEERVGQEKGKLFPTDVGFVVNDFLMKHFKDVLEYSFTADVEKQFDDIARGQQAWEKMIDAFYKPFHKNIKHTKEHAERATGERKLGKDPRSGRPVIARMGKYGPMVQMGTRDDEEKPRFAKLLPGQNIETVTLEDALELFRLPNELGALEGEKVVTSVGKYGPYVRHKDRFYSLPKTTNVLKVTLEEAIQLIKAKREEQAKREVQVFPKAVDGDDMKILRGPYGPYIAVGRKNVALPKGKDPEALSKEECLELFEAGKNKKRRGGKPSGNRSRKTKSGKKKKS